MRSSTLFIIISIFFLTSLTPLGGGKAFGAAPVPDPGEPGPFAAGSISFAVPAPHRGGDLIRVIVWYPVDKNLITNSTPTALYPLYPIPIPVPPFVLTLPSTLWELFGIDPAYRGVTPAGAFPLVVISHGCGTVGWFHLYNGARLASHGFIVASLNHPQEPLGQCSAIPLTNNFLNRPKDISSVIDELLNRNNSSGDLLYHAIQIDKIYAMGQSLGGHSIVKAFTGGDTRIKGLISLDGLLSFDIHVDGTVSYDLMAGNLAQVTIPALLFSEEPCEPPPFNSLPKFEDGSSVDHGTFPLPGGPLLCDSVEECLGPMRAQALIPSNPDLIVVKGSDHAAAFTNVCEFLSIVGAPLLPACTSGDVVPFMEAHHLVNKYSVAFLKRLSGERKYGQFFAPGNFLVNEPEAELIKTQPGSFESIDQMNAAFFCNQPGQ
jgi:platelet-activating factor acetylhydrolase isoform II